MGPKPPDDPAPIAREADRAALNEPSDALARPAPSCANPAPALYGRRGAGGGLMNVLFVSIEDLNDYVEPLGGHPDAVTPNIARFARRAAVFEKAYATAPVCGPSRNAVLFGQAPWRTGLYINPHYWDRVHARGARLSLFGHARDAGFATLGGGKIFMRSDQGIDPDEWDEYSPVRHPGRQPVVSDLVRRGVFKPMQDYGPIPDEEVVYDQRNADWISAQITPGADRRFWALGLFRPHMPFLSHRRYFDMVPETPARPPGLSRDYDPLAEEEIAHLPQEARESFVRPKIGRRLHQAGEYSNFLRAYLASVAFADDLFGKVMKRLEDTGQADNTVVVLWSDHGMQFGEKLSFSKFTLWERALRIPMMIAGPGIAPRRIGAPVTNMDLFPTILSMIGARPKQACDGRDLAPLLAGEREASPRLARAVWGVVRGRDDQPDRLAFTVRTESHRFTRYWRGGRELYHNAVDPFEKRNLLSAAGPVGRWRARRLARRLAPLLPAAPAPAVDVKPPSRETRKQARKERRLSLTSDRIEVIPPPDRRD